MKLFVILAGFTLGNESIAAATSVQLTAVACHTTGQVVGWAEVLVIEALIHAWSIARVTTGQLTNRAEQVAITSVNVGVVARWTGCLHTARQI